METATEAPYGGRCTFGDREVGRAEGKAYTGRRLNDEERHALQWAWDIKHGRSRVQALEPEARELVAALDPADGSTWIAEVGRMRDDAFRAMVTPRRWAPASHATCPRYHTPRGLAGRRTASRPLALAPG